MQRGERRERGQRGRDEVRPVRGGGQAVVAAAAARAQRGGQRLGRAGHPCSKISKYPNNSDQEYILGSGGLQEHSLHSAPPFLDSWTSNNPGEDFSVLESALKSKSGA